jgi:hypothetical protein
MARRRRDHRELVVLNPATSCSSVAAVVASSCALAASSCALAVVSWVEADTRSVATLV